MLLIKGFLLALTSNAFPQGSATCIADPKFISLGHLNQPQDLGYTLKFTKTKESIQISLANPKRDTLKGILMYVTLESNETIHLGKFSKDSLGNKFKFMDTKVCDKSFVQGSNEATITHSNPTDVQLPTFTWLPSDPADLNRSDLFVSLVVATGESPAKNPGKPIWQHGKIAIGNIASTDPGTSDAAAKPASTNSSWKNIYAFWMATLPISLLF